jgi:hypothetical protein
LRSGCRNTGLARQKRPGSAPFAQRRRAIAATAEIRIAGAGQVQNAQNWQKSKK